MKSHSIRKILLIRFSSLGDIIMTTAMIRCVRLAYPNAQIDMIVRADFLDLIRDNPHLNAKIGLDRRSGFRGLVALYHRIQSERYDLIYDAHRSLRTLFMMPFLRARHKAYFAKHYLRRNLSLVFKLPWLKGMGRFLERYITPLHKYGVRYDGLGPEMFTSIEKDEAVQKKMPLPGPKDAIWVGLIPSAQWPGKRWPIRHFRSTVEKIVEGTNWKVFVFGGKSDGFCHEIVSGLPADRVVNGQGKLSISETASILKKCRFVIANDTGLMHMADALNVPQVLIFGPTSADLGCLPFHPLTQIAERSLWCRPCSKNGEAPCIRLRRVCLEDLPPSNVFSLALTLAKKIARK